MIVKEIKRHRTIQTKSPKEFDQELDRLMNDIALKSPNVERFFDATIGHCAYVEWTEEVMKSESIKDDYELKGMRFVCGDCPMCILPEDRRIKNFICERGERVYYDRPACIWFYEGLESGVINPYEKREEKKNGQGKKKTND